jgi:hypothetical protein
MSQKLIGVAVRGNKANEVLDMIERAEQLGIHAAWMTTGGSAAARGGAGSWSQAVDGRPRMG